jgi:hypothetical protein
VLTPRTFEGAHIKTGLPRRDARQKHLRRASRAIWTRVNRRVFECVFGKRHFATFLFAGGSAGTLSHRRLDRIAVGDVLKVTLFPCGTVRNGSPPGLQRASLPCNPCELFDTESESDTAQRQQMPGASKPPAPKRLCGKTCVQDPSEASLGSFAFYVSGRTSAQQGIVSGRSLRARSASPSSRNDVRLGCSIAAL